MDLHDLFSKLIDHMKEHQNDESDWIPVAQLKPEDITRKAIFHSARSKLKGEGSVLVARIKAIEAQLEALHQAYWEALYCTYNLPREASYSINDKNQILKKPKKRDGAG